MSESYGGENQAATFLGRRHAEQFKALGVLTGAATEILDPPALSPGASRIERRADNALLDKMNHELTEVVVGPQAAADARHDFNGKEAPIPIGEKTIVADATAAPVRTAAGGYDYLETFLGLHAASNAIEYLRDKRHQEFVEIATGRYSHYYAASSRINLASPGTTLNILAPVGEYGPEEALDLLKATYHAMAGANPRQLQQLDVLGEKDDNRNLILYHTTYGRNERVAYGTELLKQQKLGKAIARSVFEGDLSIQQEISLLTAEQVEGFETMASLWRAIRKGRLVEKLTRLLPFGDLAPMTEMNMFIPGLVKPAGHDEVMLDPEIKEQLKTHKAAIQSDLMEYFKEHPEAAPNNDMGIFCPALAHGGGLSKRHEVVYRRFEALKRPKSVLGRLVARRRS